MNIVVNMLARPNKIKTSQMRSISNVDSGMEIYLRNSYVCLCSVKHFNPNVECMLVCDYQLQNDWIQRFHKRGISIKKVDFGGFDIDDEFNWGIVQYRYNVMSFLTNTLNPLDKVVMLDTDVICVGSLDSVFDEITNRMLLFDVQHDASHTDRLNIIHNYQVLYPEITSHNLIHYGGEFIGANIEELTQLFKKSVEVMNRTTSGGSGLNNFNDEHITSIAVDLLWKDLKVNNANAYIYRYWTNKNFLLTSTNWYYNPVVLWHLPSEKNNVFLYLYKKTLDGVFPSKEYMAKLFGLPEIKRTHIIMGVLFKIKRKLGFYK